MIQIDIEMPKDCEECPLCHRAFDGNETRLACYGLGAWCLGDEGRLDNCPLHEVTYSDTISRQDAINLIERYCDNGCEIAEDKWCPDCQQGKFAEMIKALPPSPSKPKGRWILLFNGKFKGGSYWFQCSECERIVPEVRNGGWNFCPNCGADMLTENKG